MRKTVSKLAIFFLNKNIEIIIGFVFNCIIFDKYESKVYFILFIQSTLIQYAPRIFSIYRHLLNTFFFKILRKIISYLKHV